MLGWIVLPRGRPWSAHCEASHGCLGRDPSLRVINMRGGVVSATEAPIGPNRSGQWVKLTIRVSASCWRASPGPRAKGLPRL